MIKQSPPHRVRNIADFIRSTRKRLPYQTIFPFKNCMELSPTPSQAIRRRPVDLDIRPNKRIRLPNSTRGMIGCSRSHWWRWTALASVIGQKDSPKAPLSLSRNPRENVYRRVAYYNSPLIRHRRRYALECPLRFFPPVRLRHPDARGPASINDVCWLQLRQVFSATGRWPCFLRARNCRLE